MYNYNATENGIGGFIRDLVIKLIFVIILVLLLIWLFPMPNMQPFYDRIYTENIVLMKDTAKNYYTNERLPVNVNDKVTMTLGEMVDKHLILNLIDKKGNTCNAQNSYVEVTKLETEYAMKVYLNCGDESDYIIEYIGCLDVCLGFKCETITTPLVAPVAKVVYKPASVIKPPVVVVKPPVVVTPAVETWILYAKPTTTTLSDYSTTKPVESTTTTNGITTTITLNDTKQGPVTTKLVEKTETIYSAMYVYGTQSYPANMTYPGTRLLDLNAVGLSQEARNLSRNDLNLNVSNYAYFTNSDYQRYLDTRFTSLYLGQQDCPYCSNAMSATQMSNASLKSSNFTINKPTVNWNSNESTYQVRTTAYLKNASGVTPFYDAGLKANVVYIPHKFMLSWNEPTNTSSTLYNAKTTVSYTEKWVLKGSSEASSLVANGFYAKDSKTIAK